MHDLLTLFCFRKIDPCGNSNLSVNKYLTISLLDSSIAIQKYMQKSCMTTYSICSIWKKENFSTIWHHRFFKNWSLQLSYITWRLHILKQGYSPMLMEKSSRQNYRKIWLLTGVSKLFIAVKKYVTIVRKLPQSQQNYSFQKWYVLHENRFR